MNTLKCCRLAELAEQMPGDVDHLIVSASYEERAYGIWEHIQRRINGRKFVCFNANHLTYLGQNLDRFCFDDPSAKTVALDSDVPHTTFEALREMIDGLRDRACHIAIDITGFTKEALAILLYLAKSRLAEGSRVTAFYHRAEKYGKSQTKGWLSQGVREVRTILGYSGQMRATADTHFLMIAGFESERAQAIIDCIEPSRLSLGIIAPANPNDQQTNPHDDTLRAFIGRVKSLYAGTRLDEFEFSPRDPIFTKEQILKTARVSTDNVVLSCLNSKIAMVGSCLAAMEHPNIQLIYAQPLFYNIVAYSEPSGKADFFGVRF